MRHAQQGKWTFGLLWMIANTFSWAMYGLIAAAAGWFAWEVQSYFSLGRGTPFLGDSANQILIASMVLGLCWGTLVGVLQQFVLVRRIEIEGKKWVLATVIGLTLYEVLRYLAALVVGFWGMSMPIYAGVTSSCAFAFSFALGIAQWFILRRRVTKSGWWIFITALALSLSTYIGSVLSWGYHGGIVLVFASPAVEGLIYSVVTLMGLAILANVRNASPDASIAASA